MLSSLAHRGPDDAGIWVDADAGIVLGHRRLSVIDPPPLGHQPMVSADGQLAVVFNGEIYNFPERRRELLGRGVRFASNSDTEVLLYGYREWGERVVDRLVGMYAFAIWDARAARLFLARDRAGEKPLYYASGSWGFAFASELGALTTLPGVCTEIDPEALSLYLQYQYVPAPHSIYRHVYKLPPAHAMRVQHDGVTVSRYWDPVPLAAGPPSIASSFPPASCSPWGITAASVSTAGSWCWWTSVCCTAGRSLCFSERVMGSFGSSC